MTEYQDIFDKFKRDVDYYEAHREELLQRYPEQWIAIRDRKVLGVAANPDDLRDDLRETGQPTDRVLVRHLTAKEDMLVL